jgi:signal transduction histidine kinase
MAPETPGRELLSPYTEALVAYLRESHGMALSKARDLGNRAVIEGLSVSEICGIHHESLRRMGAAIPGDGARGHHQSLLPVLGQKADSVAVAGAFLAETLAAFESGQRELRLLNTALRRQNQRLEGELRRVSKVMYDECLQLVSATRLSLAGSDPAPQPAVWNLLERLEEQLLSCAGSLQSRIVEDLGLASAIQFLSRHFAKSCQLDVITEAAIGPLPKDVSIALYRSVLEALTNVHRHARANCVRISLCEECSVIRCSIRDDGVGFDISRALSEAEVQGSGFLFIQESLRLVGGTLVVESVPGGSTELRISICPRAQD